MRRTIMFCYCLIGWIAVWSISSARANEDLPRMNGWYLPTGKWFDTSKEDEFFGFQEFNEGWPGYHLGIDIKKEAKIGDPVYSLAQGEIIVSRTDVDRYGPNRTDGGAVLIKYQAVDGTVFVALYGHLDNPHAVGSVGPGDVVGNMNAWNPPHLHLGIIPKREGWPENPVQWPLDPYKGYWPTPDNGFFVNPMDFLNSHTPQILPLPNHGLLTVTTTPVRGTVVVSAIDTQPRWCYRPQLAPYTWNLLPGRYMVQFYKAEGDWHAPTDPIETRVELGKETKLGVNYANGGVSKWIDWVKNALRLQTAYGAYEAGSYQRIFDLLPIDQWVNGAVREDGTLGPSLASHNGEAETIVSNGVQDDPEAAARRREAIRQLYAIHLLRVPSQAEIDGWFDFLV